MTQLIDGYTAKEIAAAAKVALTMEAMVGRLTYDDTFAATLANNPRETLANAGMLMEKEAVEVLMATEPERFDKICEALFGLVDSDFLHKMVSPSCDSPVPLK
ncbi:MAG TPA: hypothetical protein VGP04_21395 [Pseudonocardiaceae bacterium]|nr:hypothetical protein [Pseudonocardiaceae bacterium]